MHKILLLDVRSERRERLRKVMEQAESIEVDARSAIDRAAYESGEFEVAVVHYGNKEGPFIEYGWGSGGMKVVLFSGGFTQPVAESEGTIYASASYLEEGENLKNLIERLVVE